MAINLIQEYGKDTVLKEIYNEIQEVYLSDPRPILVILVEKIVH